MKKNLWETATEGLGRLLFLIPSQPEVAQIEVTNRCNFSCLMCQRIDLKVPLKDMEEGLYRKIIDRLGLIKEVILTGWGEPLIHSKIFEMIKYAKKKDKFVSLTTNGSLLTADMAQKLLDSGPDSLSFSVDDIRAPKTGSMVHPVTTQIRNIEAFMKLIKEEKGKPEVIIQVTLHKGKENKVLEIVRWASIIGANMVNVNRLDMRFNPKLRRPNYKEEKEFTRQLDEAGKKYSIQTEFRSHIAFSGLLRLVYRFLVPYMARGGKHCLRVYNYVYINQKGEVTPCCALPIWAVGNLLKDDLAKIWRSEKFNKFRQHEFQRNICGKCDVLEIKQYC